MNSILKFISIFALAFALLGCQGDGSEETSQQQQSPQDQLGQMQQQSAPDIDLSEEEAETFANAAMAAQKIQMESQDKMVKIIEDEGLNLETYQKIAQSQQMGQGSSDSLDVSDSDMEKYNNATDSIQQAQSDVQQEIAEAIEAEGMEMQRFQEISQAAQQDPELQKLIRQKIQEKMGQQGGQGGMQQQPPTNN